MKKITLLILFCCAAVLSASEPVWKYTLGEKEITVTASIPANEYLYWKETAVELTAGEIVFKPVTFPSTVTHEDEFSGKTEIYPGGKLLTWIFRSEKWNFPLKFNVKWQGCSKGTPDKPGACFVPGSGEMTIRNFQAVSNPKVMTFEPTEEQLSSPAPNTDFPKFEIIRAESGFIGAPQFVQFLKGEKRELFLSFAGKSFWLILLLTFLGGIALNLTPCVLPMIPINLAIIGARDGSRWSCMFRGLVYGAGIALAYGILGIAVVVTGSSFGVIDSAWWFNALVALLFIGLGLSMFDVFILDFSRFSSSLPGISGARYAGIFLMGVVAALLAGACVAPVVVAALLQSGRMYNSGETAGLFLPLVLGLGMALPWPVLAGGFAVIPRPGNWMKWVKYLFGVIIICLGLYYAFLSYEIVTSKSGNPGKSIDLLKESLRRSAREKKPVLLDFRAEWCKNCKAMEQSTFKDPAVIDELKNFIFVKFDATDISNPEISVILKKFDVSGLPAYLIIQGR